MPTLTSDTERRLFPRTGGPHGPPSVWGCNNCASWTGYRLCFAALGFFDRDLVRPAVAPTIPHHCSDDFMRGCATLAREFGVGLHTHVQESKVQVMVGLKRYGKTPTAHLQDLGLLGPDFTVAHGVWLDHDDMARLGDHGASVAHNPGSNMRLGNGLADVRGMLARKVNVGIGTDGTTSAVNATPEYKRKFADEIAERQKRGISVPPCFIVVCQNTAISKLVYDYISGFYQKNESGETHVRKMRRLRHFFQAFFCISGVYDFYPCRKKAAPEIGRGSGWERSGRGEFGGVAQLLPDFLAFWRSPELRMRLRNPESLVFRW